MNLLVSGPAVHNAAGTGRIETTSIERMERSNPLVGCFDHSPLATPLVLSAGLSHLAKESSKWEREPLLGSQRVYEVIIRAIWVQYKRSKLAAGKYGIV